MPHRSGMPTKPQARTSSRGVVPPLLSEAISASSGHADCVVDGLELHVMPIVDGSDQEIGDEANHQQPGHDVHGDIIGLGFRNAAVDLKLPYVVDKHWAKDACSRPRGKKQSVNRADIAGAEHILEIGWHSGEAAAIHTDDDEETQDEQRQTAGAAEVRHERVEHDPEHKEHEIGVLAANEVGRRGPEETPAHVEDTEQPDKT